MEGLKGRQNQAELYHKAGVRPFARHAALNKAFGAAFLCMGAYRTRPKLSTAHTAILLATSVGTASAFDFHPLRVDFGTGINRGLACLVINS